MPDSASLSRKKRRLFSLALLCLLWMALEVASLGALFFSEGASPLRKTLAKRQRISGLAAVDPLERPEVSQAMASEVLHPYLGFVFNPELNEDEERRARGDLRITDLGFFRDPGPPHQRTGEEIRIGVVGGSAAFLFSFTGRSRLKEALEASPLLRGRKVVVDSFAMGGYKQPQQLLTLVYLLALGERFDILVNIDGFNEITLPYRENLPHGVFFAYPRSWHARVESVPDAEFLVALGRVADLRTRRRTWARGFSRRPFSHSPACNLLWRAHDRVLARRIASFESGLQSFESERKGYLAQGPTRNFAGDAETFQELAAIWRRGSLQLHRLSAANGIRYFHFLQPNQYVPDSKPLTRMERAEALLSDHPYRSIVKTGYPHLQKEGEALLQAGVDFSDLSLIFADVTETLYVDTCCHFNKRGNEIVAAVVADRVLEDLAGSPLP